MYAIGEGVPKNDAEAYFWWNLAAAQGDGIAK
jgi:TPR repeat protein